MIHIFHGDDNFTIHEELRNLQQATGAFDAQDSNIFIIDSTEFEIAQFIGAVQAIPFLANRRLAVIRGLLTNAEERRGRRRQATTHSNQAFALRLSDILKGIPPTTDVVFVDERITSTNIVFQAIKPLAKIREFPLPRGDSLARWIRQKVEEKGSTIAPAAISLLMDQVGNGLWSMASELEKLTTYCGSRTINATDVNDLVPETRQPTVFAAVDAIIERRMPLATSLMDRLLRGGATAPYLLSMIGRQARLITLAHELRAKGIKQDQWGQRLGIQQEFVLRKTVEQARRYLPAQLHTLYLLLLEADLSTKATGMSDELIITEFLAKASMLKAAI